MTVNPTRIRALVKSMFRRFGNISSLNKKNFSSFEINGINLLSPFHNTPNIPFVEEKYEGLLDHPTSLSYIYFLARKDSLKQDSLLLSESGNFFFPRLLAERFCQLAQRESEYVVINSDTSEHDLKQKREFVNNNVVYRNEKVVSAALNGRTLILEGLERAEANMLPLLNNLLENREMSLDDGSLIVSSSKYQHLLKNGNTEEQLKRNGIIRCDPNFKVIALALPVPPFHGLPLDPPLRSRLQCRYVREPSSQELCEGLVGYYGNEIAHKTTNVVNSLKLVSEQKEVDLPKLSSAVSFAFSLAEAFHSRGTENVNVVEVVERLVCGNKKQYGAGLKMVFGSDVKKESEAEFYKSLKAAILIGPKGCGRRYKALEISKIRESFIEIMSLTPDMSSVELFQIREGSNENTFYQDTPLVRAMRNGSVCILEGIENTPQFVPIFTHLLQRNDLKCSDGSHFVSEEKYAHLMESYNIEQLNTMRVFKIHPKFCILGIQSSEDVLSSPWITDPFVSIEVKETSLKELQSILSKYTTNKNISSSVALFYQKLNEMKKAKNVKIEFSISNAINCVKLSEKIDPLTNIKDCTLYQFQSLDNQKKIDDLLHSSQITAIAKEEQHTETSKVREEKTEHHHHLIPNVTYFENESSEGVIEKIAHYIDINVPLLLVGLQGVGKNLLVDHALQRMNLKRQYQQLHRDTTVSTLWSVRTIEDGKITFQSSPLLTAIQEGQCIVLDEIDKANHSVIATLRSLIGGMFRMSDGRMIVSELFKENVPQSILKDCIVIHPNFRLILLANPGVAPFLGANVLKSVGHFTNAICVNPPNLKSMIAILNSYNDGHQTEQMISNIAKSFSDLLQLNLSGKLQYSYGLREAISVVKDLKLTNDLEISLKNVFDYEIPNQTRKSIQSVFSKNGITLKEFGSVGTISEKEKIGEYTRHSGEKSMGPKPGKASDGKQHVGGNTWQGGTGGRDTAGMGGKHGPYRVFGGHDIHQLSDAEKEWKDKEMEQKAKQMAKDALQKKLKEIDMGEFQYEVYNNYLNNISSYLPSLRLLLKNIQPNKERKWIKGQTEGDLDDNKLVDALSGEKNVYKRKGKREQTNNPQNSNGNFYIRFVLDASASMYRFNHVDHRLERSLEACLLLLEGFSECDLTRIHYGIYAHTGEEMMIKLVDSDEGDIPENIKERFKVLERIVSRSQFTWSGDFTLEATEKAIYDLEMKGNENDERRVFIFSDANFRRYGISPNNFKEILESSKKVQSTAILMGQLGHEAENIQRVMGDKNAFICFDTSQIVDILAQQLRTTFQSTHL